MTSDLTLNATCVLGPVAVLTFSGGDQIVEKWQGIWIIFLDTTSSENVNSKWQSLVLSKE